MTTDAPGVRTAAPPLTVGTAGHIDHGKSALVRVLTGTDPDRLPEEQRRGITIALGYAALTLPSGRVLSLVDVPGHERLIRVMVSGATGIDLYLLAVAADDGVMPQTLEHVRALRALGVERGVVAITKADLADPGPAAAQAAELLPAAVVTVCSARTGEGLDGVRAALEQVAAQCPSRGARPGEPVLHVDRVFTITGAGTVVTGTLWAGTIAAGDHLVLWPGERAVRVRSVQVHDDAVAAAPAGQRVAVNLAGVDRRSVAPGDVLAGARAPVTVTYRVDATLALDEAVADGERVQVHHGTRDAPARAVMLGDALWQLRLEAPVVAAAGDRLVVRRIAPPDTIGGGTIADPSPRRRRTVEDPAAAGAPDPLQPPAAAPQPLALPAAALAVEERLRAAGHEPPSEAELGEDAAEIPALRAAGRAVRVGRAMYAHPEAIARVRAVVEQQVAAHGAVTLAQLRDALGTSRKYAQALLEHLDAERVTVRRPDDSRVLRRRREPGTPHAG